MKNTIKFLLFVSVFSFVLVSCIDQELEDRDLGEEKIDKNDGYLPLSPNKYWKYENAIADFDNNTRRLTYTDLETIPDTELYVPKINIYDESVDGGAPVKKINYELAPIADPGFFGNLTGNLQQIYKNPTTTEYIKSEILTLKVVENSVTGEEDQLVINLKDFPFLKDTAQPGDILYSKFDEIVNKSDFEGTGKSTIRYVYRIRVVGKYNKIPLKYANTIGVDDQLLAFSDIMHIREELEIIDIVSEGATVTTVVDAKVLIDPSNQDSYFKANISTNHSAYGVAGQNLFLGAAKLIAIPLLSTDDGFTRSYSKESLKTLAPYLQADLCPAVGDFSGTETSTGSTLKIVSNQIPFTRDVFYARNIGRIKTITSMNQIVGEIRIESFDTVGDPFEILPVKSYGCLEENLIRMNNMMLGLVNESKTKVSRTLLPLIFAESKAVVSNLKSYYVK